MDYAVSRPVGRPVYGMDFYGHETLLRQIYYGKEWGTWVIGGRRMGKTSLLHQIRHLTLDASDRVAILCNWQPAENLDNLTDIFIEAVEDADLIELVQQVRDLPFYRALKLVVQQVPSRIKQIFLLIDEPDAILFKLAAISDTISLGRLRSSLLQGGKLHTVITSGPKLRMLYDLNWHTSPFWEGFDRAYIGQIEPQAAINLIQQTQSKQPAEMSTQLINAILAKTGRIPWLTQWVSRELELRSINFASEIPGEIWRDREHDQRFEADYAMFSVEERAILRAVGQSNRPIDVDEIVQISQISKPYTLQHLDLLMKLGYIEMHVEGFYKVSNYFLHKWLKLGLWQTVKIENDRPPHPQEQPTISAIRTKLKTNFDHTTDLEELCQDLELNMSNMRRGTVTEFIVDIIEEARRSSKLFAVQDWINHRLNS